MDVELRHLKWMTVTAQEGSFLRAAKSLQMRQSTLSRASQHVE
jgi:DNA-binding transcriptional LysR family regulator